MLLSDLLAARGWSNEDAAKALNERGLRISNGPRAGEPFTGNDVSRRRGKAITSSWRAAFGVTPEEASPRDPGGEGGGSGDPGDGTDSTRRRETPPTRPDEAMIAVVEAGAAKRIAGAYKFAGAALAAGSGSQGVAHVWGDQSDRIAELWLEAAKENVWAARFVNMMQAGGPMGDLAAGHLYLAGATLYVLGAGIPGGDAVFAKYSRYRPVTQPPAGANGTAVKPEAEPVADDPAAGAVVDAPA